MEALNNAIMRIISVLAHLYSLISVFMSILYLQVPKTFMATQPQFPRVLVFGDFTAFVILAISLWVSTHKKE